MLVEWHASTPGLGLGRRFLGVPVYHDSGRGYLQGAGAEVDGRPAQASQLAAAQAAGQSHGHIAAKRLPRVAARKRRESPAVQVVGWSPSTVGR